jgi:LysR family nitrogen assimilation transcriptional regulator
MDLRRLQFLVRIIDMGSITRAADALGIAQPALSQHVQALERSFGAALLVRGQHGVTPTEAGRVAYRNAKLLGRQMERARAEVKVLAGAPAGRVTVGVAPHSHARFLVQPLLAATRARYPDVVLHINENFEGVLAADLLLGRLDMAFLYEIVPRPGLRYRAFSAEPLRLVGHPGLLTARRGVLPLDDVKLLLPGGANALRQLIDAVFSRLRLQPRLVAEIESFQTLSVATLRGLGATILPLSVAARLAERGGLALRPFGGRGTRVALSLCTPAEEIASEAGRVIFQLASDLADAVRPAARPPSPPPPGAPAPAR